jgi:hypothetical protein
LPQVLARIDAKAATPTLVVEALPSFVEAVRRSAFYVDTMYWSPASVARISKYIAKGFECAVPGVRRAAFGLPSHEPEVKYSQAEGTGPWITTIRELTPKEKDEQDQRMLKSREIDRWDSLKGSLSSLFDMEAQVLFSRAYVPCPGSIEADYVEKIEGRLWPIEADTIASKLAGKLGRGVDPNFVAPCRPQDDYDDEEWAGENDGYGIRTSGPHTNTYGFIRESFRCDVAVRLGDARRDIPLKTNFWAFTDAGRFQPAKAYIERMYNPEKLSALAAAEAATRAEQLASADEDEKVCALLDFDEDCVLDLFEDEGGGFEMISYRRMLAAEDPSSDKDESSEADGDTSSDTKQTSGERDKEDEDGEAARPSKHPRFSPP